MIALVCGKWFPFYPATGNTYAHSPPSESIPSSRPWRCSLLFSSPNPKPLGLTLTKAGVQPEGRNDPSITLALAVARFAANHQKPNKNPCQAPKPLNSMKTNQI